jgi:ferredoxin
MADKTRKFPDNAPGRYYVDRDCVLCTTCFELAGDFFPVSRDESHRFVVRQPNTPAEIAKVESAVAGCPMGAIGDDGDT